MKNNKAFTIVEMLVSFTLSMILVIIMFQLIINLKEVYMSSGIKTEMMNKKYLITNKIYNDLNTKKVSRIENCNNPLICIQFTFQDGSIKKLEVDETNKTLAYDNYIIKLNNTSYFKTMNVNTVYSQSNKKIFNIDIPIYNDIYINTDFGINIVYPYNELELTNNYGNKYVSPMDLYIGLPYVKSNGNQYIDLNYAAKINTEIRLDIELIENENTGQSSAVNHLIAKSTRNDSNTFQVNFASSSDDMNCIFYHTDKYTTAGGQAYSYGYTSVTPRSTMIVKSGSATFQGETITVATKTANNTDKMRLLGNYSNGNDYAFNRYDTKIYGFEIYEDETQIMNLVPAKSRETDKIGLYDTVSKQFYISNGTSDFIYE